MWFVTGESGTKVPTVRNVVSATRDLAGALGDAWEGLDSLLGAA